MSTIKEIDAKELFKIDEAEAIIREAVTKLSEINGFISFENLDGTKIYLNSGFKINLTAFIGNSTPINH